MTPEEIPTDCYVEIWRFADGHVDSRMGPMTRRKAQRVQRGAMINMNHHEWGCRIVEEVKT